MFAGLVGVPATYALTLGLATAEGWSRPASGVVVGLATIVSIHAIAGYFDKKRPAVLATPLLLAGAIAPLIEMTGLEEILEIGSDFVKVQAGCNIHRVAKYIAALHNV